MLLPQLEVNSNKEEKEMTGINLCDTCANLRKWSESHPYGSTTASEHFQECTVEAEEFYSMEAEALGIVEDCSKYSQMEGLK